MKASLFPNFAIEISAASLISVGPYSMTVAFFTADIDEFMIRLPEISAKCDSYWLVISTVFQPGAQGCREYALSSVWPRFPSQSRSAVIKVQHILPIRRNIQHDHVLLLDQRKSFNATVKNAITNTCLSNDMIPTTEASLVLLQSEGHSNN